MKSVNLFWEHTADESDPDVGRWFAAIFGGGEYEGQEDLPASVVTEDAAKRWVEARYGDAEIRVLEAA